MPVVNRNYRWFTVRCTPGEIAVVKKNNVTGDHHHPVPGPRPPGSPFGGGGDLLGGAGGGGGAPADGVAGGDPHRRQRRGLRLDLEGFLRWGEGGRPTDRCGAERMSACFSPREKEYYYEAFAFRA